MINVWLTVTNRIYFVSNSKNAIDLQDDILKKNTGTAFDQASRCFM